MQENPYLYGGLYRHNTTGRSQLMTNNDDWQHYQGHSTSCIVHLFLCCYESTRKFRYIILSMLRVYVILHSPIITTSLGAMAKVNTTGWIWFISSQLLLQTRSFLKPTDWIPLWVNARHVVLTKWHLFRSTDRTWYIQTCVIGINIHW